jgi:hypothetical protein
MRLPGFTAETCLYKTSEEYIGFRNMAGTSRTESVMAQILPGFPERCCYEHCFVIRGVEHCIHFCYPGSCY